jgi:multidrug transporter EmrE-like cation transporter
MISIGYLIILVVSWSLFGERLAPVRYAGAGLMLIGLWLLVR